jgi:hypothetical protein
MVHWNARINIHLWLRRSGRRVRQVAPADRRGEASPAAPEAGSQGAPEAGNQGAPVAEDDRRMVLRYAAAEPRSADTAPAVQHTWKRTYFFVIFGILLHSARKITQPSSTVVQFLAVYRLPHKYLQLSDMKNLNPIGEVSKLFVCMFVVGLRTENIMEEVYAYFAVVIFGSFPILTSACIGKLYLLHREKKD